MKLPYSRGLIDRLLSEGSGPVSERVLMPDSTLFLASELPESGRG